MPVKLPIDKTILIEGTFKEMCITFSENESHCKQINSTEARHYLKKIQRVFVCVFLTKIANFAKDKNEHFKCQIFDRKQRLIFDSLKRAEAVFYILSGLHHRTDPRYHIKSIG